MSSGQVFLLECISCGAKITSHGSVVGGSSSCNPHNYGPVGNHHETPLRRQKIVYPTEAERSWLRLIDQNKNENVSHYKQFTEDLSQLNKLKSVGIQQISSTINELRAILDEKENELVQELNEAFEERQSKIHENMKALKEHRNKNEETKDNSEELLVFGNKPVKEREKIIVEGCQNIINTTPNIKYVNTELRYTFDQLTSIKRKISESISQFETLHTISIDSGEVCTFKSIKDAINAPLPLPVQLPSITTKTATFDEKQQKIKLGFKITGKNDIKKEVMEYLYIHVLCARDDADDDSQPIHEENVPFKDCKQLDFGSGTRYIFYVNNRFKPGKTVDFKIKPEFISPDKPIFGESLQLNMTHFNRLEHIDDTINKIVVGYIHEILSDNYVIPKEIIDLCLLFYFQFIDIDCLSAAGKWSRIITYDIPDGVVFNIEFRGKSDNLILYDDDSSLHSLDQFATKFMNTFNISLKPNDKLILSTSDGILNEKSNLSIYASEHYVITGKVLTSTASSEKQVLNKEKVMIWLEETVELQQYVDVLINHGYDDLEKMAHITLDELVQIGIAKGEHRQKIMKYAKKINH